jgi:very-short-patch-repair endonuclease
MRSHHDALTSALGPVTGAAEPAPEPAPEPEPDRAAIERGILRLAGRQHGVVTRPQLRALGLKAGAVDRRVAAARLTALHRGVYRVGPPVAPLAREMAAVLACGGASALDYDSASGPAGGGALPGARAAALSHGSAAHLLGIAEGPRARGPVEVAVVGSCRARPGIRIHRARSLPAGEVTRREGIPVTTPARTILDLAASLETRELERMMAEAIALRATTPAKLLALAGSPRHARRPGVWRVRAMLAGDNDPARTRSAAEEGFLGLIRSTDLPQPEANAPVGRYQVDFLWRAQRIVVEVDGFAFHSSPRSFEADHRRESDLDAAGYHVLRFTWRQIQETPTKVIGRVCRAVGRAEGRVEGRG